MKDCATSYENVVAILGVYFLLVLFMEKICFYRYPCLLIITILTCLVPIADIILVKLAIGAKVVLSSFI